MKASDKQVGGNHYKDFPIQPGEFCVKNGIKGFQQNIIYRICRYDKPTGKGLEDLEKIKHEVDLLIEWEGWGEEKHWEKNWWKSQLEQDIENEAGRIQEDIKHTNKPDKKPAFTYGLPKLRLCEKCGETPYMNWGNGQYWIECPFCHTVGCKSSMQYGAQAHWNEDEDSGRGI